MNFFWKIFTILIFGLPIQMYPQAKTLRTAVFTNEEISPITVGDSIPDFLIPKLINSKTTNYRISDFDNQLLLIDFWSTLCSGCIAALPRMEALQKRFGNQIKILPVTYENRDVINKFWKKNKYTRSNTLPSVVEDKIFHAYFPHIGVPHEVWIYKRKVIGITTADYVDAPNIQQILSDEKIKWKIKNDFYKYDYKQSIFEINGNVTKPLIYSALSGYKPGVNTMGFSGGRAIDRNKKNNTVRTYILNEPIHVMYKVNFMSTYKMGELVTPSGIIDSNQTVWEVEDRSKYRWSYKDNRYSEEWILKAGYCFESLHPDTGQSDADIYKNVNAELDRLLGLHVRWEKRTERVWVLREKSDGITKQIRGEKEGNGITVSGLVSKLNNQEDHPYVFDESPMNSVDSRVSSNIWIKFNPNPSASINDINIILNAYGLILTEEVRTVDKLIFTEKKIRKGNIDEVSPNSTSRKKGSVN